MEEYLEREAVRKALYEADEITFDGLDIIDNYPAADVQPVVRCINCKYYEGLACCKLIGDCGGTNWFCGWGEPKEE